MKFSFKPRKGMLERDKGWEGAEMKRTLCDGLPAGVPSEMARFLAGARVYDSSCSPLARVFLIEKHDGYYLKASPRKTLAREAEMATYFHRKGLGVSVLAYESGEMDYLLTARAKGEDCTHAQYLSDPTRLCDTLAEHLRVLHETDCADCPVQNRMADYFAVSEENYRAKQYDLSFGQGYQDVETAYTALAQARTALTGRVLLHGDYCLPNVILDGWRFSAMIDLGNGGVGDPHIDLFWGAWTLNYNLGTDAYRARFFDAYGRDRVCEEKIRLVSACEIFG